MTGKLIKVVKEQAETIEKLNDLIKLLAIDNSEKENFINEVCKKKATE